MKELTLNGRTYLSTKRAAEITGYTTDYVGQLARGGKIDAQLVGRNWYISEESIKKHKFGEAVVSIKEEDEAPAPQLEVLVSATEESLEEDGAEEVLIQRSEPEAVEETKENVLEEMQGAWQDWYKAQRSVPEEDEAVFLTEDEKEEGSVEIPITRAEIIEEEEVEEKLIPVEEPVQEEIPVSRVVEQPTLPVQRSWAGTGLALAGVLAVFFVGAITITAGYVLTKGTDSPVASVYQGVGDYVLGIQRIGEE